MFKIHDESDIKNGVKGRAVGEETTQRSNGEEEGAGKKQRMERQAKGGGRTGRSGETGAKPATARGRRRGGVAGAARPGISSSARASQPQRESAPLQARACRYPGGQARHWHCPR